MKNKDSSCIVILNYLNCRETVECVKSALKLKSNNYKIIIVDNGSYNKSYKIIKSEFKDIKNVFVVRNTENLGFAKGNNTGIAYARNQMKYNFVFCVNNDTIFTDGNILSELLRCCRKGIGVVGPRITGRDGKNQNPIKTGITYRKILRDLLFSAVFSLINIETLKNNYLI